MWDAIDINPGSVFGGGLLDDGWLDTSNLGLASLLEGGSESNVFNSLPIDILDVELEHLNGVIVFDLNTLEIPAGDNDALVFGDDRTLANEMAILGDLLIESLLVDSNATLATHLLAFQDIEAEIEGAGVS